MARDAAGRVSVVAGLLVALVAAVLGAVAVPSPAPAQPAGERAAQQVRLTLPTQVVQRRAARAHVAVVPRRKGRPVVLQQRAGGRWKRVASARTDPSGRVSFSVPTRTPRRVEYRAFAGRFRGLAATRSARDVLTVVSAELPTVAVPGADALEGTVVVAGTSPTDGAVAVYVDGVRVGTARAARGRWSLRWDASTVAPGRHELSARAGGPTGRLSMPLPVTVADRVDADPTLPAGFRLETVAAGFTLPTTFVPLTADSALVAEKAGVVRLTRGGRVVDRPVLDLRGVVRTEGDMGLIGMAVAPDFDRETVSGRLFLAYVYQQPGWDDVFVNTQRVVRYDVTGGVGDPGSATVLLGHLPASACDGETEMRTSGCMPTLGAGHTVDDLLFDDQGRLLVSVGDSAIFWGATDEGRRAQDPDVLAGKVLRIDPDTGLGVPGNPWYQPGADAPNRSRVLALGLRNPFRMAIHPGTGDLYVGDVGASSVEEINRVQPGANYGWPCYEGTRQLTWPTGSGFCPAFHERVGEGQVTVTGPVHSYPHTASGGSLTLGDFYRGSEYPEEYHDRLFFGDYAQPFLRTIGLAGSTVTRPATDFVDPRAAGGPVDFAQGPDGRMWHLDIMAGKLLRLRYDESCADGTFTASYFDGGLAAEPVREQCEAGVAGEWGDSSPAPGVAADGFAVRWQARVELEGGTYRFIGDGSNGRFRVLLDDEVVLDSSEVAPAPQGTVVRRLQGGLHEVVVEYAHTTGPAAMGLVWAREGSGPEVRLTTPYPGVLVGRGESVRYRVVATDAEDGTIPAEDVSVLVEALHFTGVEHFHAHPEGQRPGRTGLLAPSDDHAPGQQAYRLTAFATDSSGWRARSGSVYVCLKGNRVGPCG